MLKHLRTNAKVKRGSAVPQAVKRRHPKGLKVHVHSVDRYGCLAALTRVLKAANLSVTRAKVRLGMGKHVLCCVLAYWYHAVSQDMYNLPAQLS